MFQEIITFAFILGAVLYVLYNAIRFFIPDKQASKCGSCSFSGCASCKFKSDFKLMSEQTQIE